MHYAWYISRISVHLKIKQLGTVEDQQLAYRTYRPVLRLSTAFLSMKRRVFCPLSDPGRILLGNLVGKLVIAAFSLR